MLIEEEFPSNVLPWRRVASETGAAITTVAKPETGAWTQAILDTITKNVKVVAISICHWTNGAYIDLEQIGQACRQNNAALVVDATQSLGAMPFSINEIQADFLIAAGYKWMLCPFGFSLLYVSQKWLEARPLEETWLARDNACDFYHLAQYSDTYLPGARKFDVGEKCTPTILPGVIAALDQIKLWGVDAIAHSLSNINEQIALHLHDLGFDLPNDLYRCPHMFGATLPEHYKSDLVSELARKNVFISQREKSLMFAPHLHVNEQDLIRLWVALNGIMG